MRSKIKEILTEHPPVDDQDIPVILVVDPQPDRRKRTTSILNENGYAVLMANSAAEAKTIAESIAKIDLIITEVVFLVGNSGVQFAEEVEASESAGPSPTGIAHLYREINPDTPQGHVQGGGHIDLTPIEQDPNPLLGQSLNLADYGFAKQTQAVVIEFSKASIHRTPA